MKLIQKYVPAHFGNPLGLARRLLATGDGAAVQAMIFAGLGLAAVPLDWALSPLERRLEMRAQGEPVRPLLVICGPPRSGTTVVYQTLVSSLPLAYFSNVVAMFPRSPLVASKFLRCATRQAPCDLRSYYGKTRGIRGTCDSLSMWDRWLGADRTQAPKRISPSQQEQMRGFFRAASRVFARPICCKNNSLNVSAHLVAEVLPEARFLCLTRQPVALATSLYRARLEIHGSATTPYGLATSGGASGEPHGVDPVEGVVEQVGMFDAVARDQQRRLGSDRFKLVSYEDFCENPARLVETIRHDLFDGTVPPLNAELAPLRRSDPRDIEPTVVQGFIEAFRARDEQ